MHYCAKPFEEVWNNTHLIFSWLSRIQHTEYRNMSWAKESAVAGLGGMMPREAARGALMLEDFQLIHNPLPDPAPEYGDLIEVIKVSIINNLDTIC